MQYTSILHAVYQESSGLADSAAVTRQNRSQGKQKEQHEAMHAHAPLTKPAEVALTFDTVILFYHFYSH